MTTECKEVFIVISCPEGELNGLQIFSSLEKAEIYCKEKNKNRSGSDEWYVEKHEVDKETLDI